MQLVYLKLQRKKYMISALIFIGILCAITGYTLSDSPVYELDRGNAATSFYSPLIYIVSYQILRYLFIKNKRLEPAYDFASTRDRVDKRNLVFADYIVFIFPIILAVIIPLIIGWK